MSRWYSWVCLCIICTSAAHIFIPFVIIGRTNYEIQAQLRRYKLMDSLARLETLSLVSKLTSEIEKEVGINDKTLAEFVIDLHTENEQKNGGLHGFREVLGEAGADFSDDFIDRMDEMIRHMHPNFKKSAKKEEDGPGVSAKGEPSHKSDTKRDERVFKGLAIPDKKPEKLNDAFTNSDSGWDRRRSPSPQPRRRSRSPPWRRRDPRDYRDRERFEDEKGRRGRPRDRLIDGEPEVGAIYDARIANITTYGAFATLIDFRHRLDGLIHVSAIADYRVERPSDVLRRDQLVKVKVTKKENKRISLSMKDVDQETGEDISGRREENGGRGNMHAVAPRPKKRLTSPERWELRQLIASGAINAADYPELEEDLTATTEPPENLEPEEEVDIEIREEEPPFLVGQTKQSIELSPIRVVKAPDGSLNRAAMNGASLAKERREEKMKEAREKLAEKKAADKERVHDPLAARPSRASEEQQEEEIPEWKRVLQGGRGVSFGKRTSLPISEQRRQLPVFEYREKLLEAVRNNQILVVVGETGSGKTTQITQYLYEEGFARHGRIGCTQPRRVAAQSVAKRVAEEVGVKLGDEVGYTVRLDDVTSPRTKIKYMTDGMLQREALQDPDMSQYSCIMLDEAHERTIATDVLFALLKDATTRRPDLKLIVTSATLDAVKFSEYFLGAPIFKIPGRTFPVEILYSKEPEMDYLDAALMTTLQIHLSEPPGDILVFLTGQEEIDTSCETLYNRMKALGPEVPELIILPVYSALPGEMQSKIFEPTPKGKRKVVLATNIAETSITIDGIYYVIDPGFVKVNAYDPKLGMDSLVISPISQAQANQRAGRAGRTGPGKCYRLYTEEAYENEMLPNTVPEIQRQNLANTILMLKAMGINDLLHFDFMDPPPTNTMLNALEELYQLSALDGEGFLTHLGRQMSEFPMEPALAKVLIASVELGCTEEILTIVSMLSMQNVFYRPSDKKNQADQKKAKFNDPTGDHMTLLNVYNGWVRSGYSKAWCSDNFIQDRSMRRAHEIRQQLYNIMKRSRREIRGCGGNSEIVRKAICSGYFRNTARRDPQEGYKTLTQGTPVYMHPSSALFQKHAEYVVYHTLLLTSKEYMTCVSLIDARWLVDVAPTFFKVADSHMSKRKKGERIQPLFNRNAKGDEWRISAQKRILRDQLESQTFGRGN